MSSNTLITQSQHFKLCYCFISSQFAGVRSHNNRKCVTVAILSSCTTEKTTAPVIIVELNLRLCASVLKKKKPKKKLNCTSGVSQSRYLAEISFRNHLYPRPVHKHADIVLLQIKHRPLNKKRQHAIDHPLSFNTRSLFRRCSRIPSTHSISC